MKARLEGMETDKFCEKISKTFTIGEAKKHRDNKKLFQQLVQILHNKREAVTKHEFIAVVKPLVEDFGDQACSDIFNLLTKRIGVTANRPLTAVQGTGTIGNNLLSGMG